MATTSIYLNFVRETEQAFAFYKSIFKTEYEGEIMRVKDVPPQEGQPSFPPEDQNLIMNIVLPLIGGVRIMGTDMPESMGTPLIKGNNVSIMLEPDTRKETERLFHALKEGGRVDMELQEMFWGDYFGAFVDQFGIQWMLNCSEKQ